MNEEAAQILRDGLVEDFDRLSAQPEQGREQLSTSAFALKMNHLKISSSQLVVEIVTAALRICGTSGYRNDSRLSVVRHLRDAHSAALMLGNDRTHAGSAAHRSQGRLSPAARYCVRRSGVLATAMDPLAGEAGLASFGLASDAERSFGLPAEREASEFATRPASDQARASCASSPISSRSAFCSRGSFG